MGQLRHLLPKEIESFVERHRLSLSDKAKVRAAAAGLLEPRKGVKRGRGGPCKEHPS